MKSIVHSQEFEAPKRSQTPKLDRNLVDCCLLGDRQAWENLFRISQPRVCAAIRGYLHSRDEELVDELSACVWHRLIQNEGRLLASFRSEQGVRLTTYLGAIARNVARDYLRSERRRRKHEVFPELHQGPNTATDSVSCPELEEFLLTLSRRERQFVRWSVSRQAIDGCFSGKRNHDYQLKYRTCDKLKTFFKTNQ